MDSPRTSQIAALIALLLLGGAILDQAVCFSCPGEVSCPAGITSLEHNDLEITCALCLSQVTETSTCQLVTLLQMPAEAPRSDARVELMMADPIFHPPRL